MFPTCSNRLLAGRNALSATVRTIFSSAPVPEHGRHAQMYSMRPRSATDNRHWLNSQDLSLFGAIWAPGRWYVPRALGQRRTTAGSQRLRGAEARIVSGIALGALAVGVIACGGGERQDVTEPSGNFPVQVTKAKFANHQRLAETEDLQLAIENAG